MREREFLQVRTATAPPLPRALGSGDVPGGGLGTLTLTGKAGRGWRGLLSGGGLRQNVTRRMSREQKERQISLYIALFVFRVVY